VTPTLTNPKLSASPGETPTFVLTGATRTRASVKFPCKKSGSAVENLLVEAKIAVTCYLFGRRAEERGAVGLWIRPCPSNLSERFSAGPFSSSDCSIVRALQHVFRAIIQD
jgi:hypothetical protein